MASFSLATCLVLVVWSSHGQASDELSRSCSEAGSATDSACGGPANDDVSAMQLRRSSHQSIQRAPSVVCPGSQTGPGLQFVDSDLYKQTHCAGNQCCPGTAATDNKTFPCPSADPGFHGCEAAAPEEIVYTLIVGTCHLKFPGLDTTTRCYNGTVPGPTLHFKPGTIVTIHYHNTLTGPNPPPFLVNITSDYNESFKDQTDYGHETQADHGLDNTYNGTYGTGSPYGHINSTNLHVHGIVVPGHQPADDVLISVLPGHNYTYTFNIPTYHMPGTHWYHPHRHHATGGQVNGGMFGAIIVKDTAGSIPPEYLAAEELLLRMDTIQATIQTTVARLSLDKLWQTESQAFVTLVNGDVMPTYKIQAGRWYRMRMVYAAEYRAIRAVLDAFAGQCQLKLIAKDGIYLNKAPRTVKAMWLASGNTADVMMSCSCTWATSCSTTMRSGWDTDVPAADRSENFTKMSAYNRAFHGELLRLAISDSKEAPCLPALPTFEVKRPCYLVDLRNASVLTNNKHNVSLDFVSESAGNQQTFSEYQRAMYTVGGDPNQLTENNTHYFAVTFDGKEEDRFMHDDQPVAATFPMEQVLEWHAGGVSFHPMHIHVQPFQLQEIEKTPYRVEPETYEEWDQVGDWKDTYFSGTASDKIRVRFAFRLRGINKFIMHCHFLNHEDQGLMTSFNVSDSECIIPNQCAEAIAANTKAGSCFTNYNTLGRGYNLVD